MRLRLLLLAVSWNFLMLNAPFGPPSASTPIVPAGIVSGDTPFEFSAVAGATWYRLWVSGPSGTVHSEWYQASSGWCTGTACTFHPFLNLPDGRYRWWVQTWGDAGAGPWSAATPFDVATPWYHWIDHTALRPGTPNLTASYDAFDSGRGGLIVEEAPGAGPRLLEMAVEVPPGMLVDGVRLCYETPNPFNGISELRLEQLGDPPDATTTRLIDGALNTPDGFCADSAQPAQPIDADAGPLRLVLSTPFPDPGKGDRIVIRGIALRLRPGPNTPPSRRLRRGPFSTLKILCVFPPADTFGPACADSPWFVAEPGAPFRFTTDARATWHRLFIQGPSGVVHDAWYETANVCAADQCAVDPGIALAEGRYTWWVQSWRPGENADWSEAAVFDVARPRLHWIDPLALRPGSAAVLTSFDALGSGVGSGPTGLIVEEGPGSGARVLDTTLTVPPGMHLSGVRICYELSDPQSPISEVRIDKGFVRVLSGPGGLASKGPACEDMELSRPYDPAFEPNDPFHHSPLRLRLVTPFPVSGAGDRIVIRAVGLYLLQAPKDG